MDSSTWIIIGISGVFFIWYIVGSILNRQVGKKYSIWIEAGLGVFQGEAKGKSLGFPVSGGRFTFTEGKDRLEKGEIIFLLESRENLPLFFTNRLQGIRDEMALRATLKTPPDFEVEIGLTNDRRFKSILNRDPQKPYHVTVDPNGFTYAWRGVKNSVVFDRLIEFQKKYRLYLVRASLRKVEPHLVLRVKMDIFKECASSKLFLDFIEASA